MLLALFVPACTVTIPIGPTDTGILFQDSGFSPRVGEDTGFAWFYWMGAVRTEGGDFSSGYFGLGALGAVEGNFVCTDLGLLEGRAMEVTPCDGCTYSFAVRVQESATEGEFCREVGMGNSVALGGMEMAFGWGPDEYAYDYGYSTVVLDDPIYMYYNGGWFLFAYSYAGNGQTHVVEDYISFVHPYFVTYNGGTYWYSGYYARH